MKSVSAALVPNRTARFSHVIVHESQIYTSYTQTHTYIPQTGMQFHKHWNLWNTTESNLAGGTKECFISLKELKIRMPHTHRHKL